MKPNTRVNAVASQHDCVAPPAPPCWPNDGPVQAVVHVLAAVGPVQL